MEKKQIVRITEKQFRELVANRVTYRLVNKKNNAELLNSVPHRDYLDLTAIYTVTFTDTGETCSFTITNEHLWKFGVSTEELDHAAWRNTRNNSDFAATSITNFFLKMFGGEPEEPEVYSPETVYVVTNVNGIYGAAVMMYPDRFASLAEALGSDLYILPSSIHEVVTVAENTYNDIELAEIKDMVKDINETEVSDEDTLGDSIYRYSRSTGRISIIA